MTLKSPTIAGLFAGCGGLDYGFQEAGFDMAWTNEIGEDAASSYQNLLSHNVVVDDIWNVIDQVPMTDVIIGGPPELDNFYLVAGFSGHSLMQSPAIGRAMSELVTFGEYRTLDLTRFGYERVLTGEKIQETNCY